ncbi:hypothetical protein ACUWCQ_25725, partial [Klebsiella pneumoniae]|uniref:hypothetical protein n=1 Tax=Klebsiella pneumoniae TaxID=573 RepID=UPI0040557639
NGLRCREDTCSDPSTQQKFDLFNKAATLLKQLLSVPLVGLFVPLLVPQLVVSREGQMAGF